MGHNFSLHNSINEFCKEKKMYFFQPHAYIDYLPPKLTIGKEWYIHYSVTNPETGKKKRFKIKLNYIQSEKERRKVAKILIAEIQQKLSLGWNPLFGKNTTCAEKPLFEIFDLFLKIKSKEMELQSMHSYKSYINVLKQWLIKKAHFNEHSYAYSITLDVGQAFLNHLEENAKVSARTYNNYISFLCSFFSWMKEKGYVRENIFIHFKKKPKRLIKKKRRLLTEEELRRLYSFLLKENKEFLAITLLCYCCFIRPKEIARLRCKDFNLKEQTVFISGDIAKNDNDSYRTLPDNIMPIMQQLDLSNKEFFVFGKHNGKMNNFKPGKTNISEKKFSDYWAHVIRPACNFPLDLQFYSLKDTGITTMLGNGVPISFVQQQADHSSVAMTAIYVGKIQKANEQLKKVQMFDKNRI